MEANLYTHKESNIRKTFLLMSLFLIFVVALGWVFSQAFGNPLILYIAVVISVVMNIVAYWSSDKIAIAMSGAKEVTREQNQYVHRMVENLAITAGLPKPRIFLMHTPQINAFATGRNPENAVIAITTGAIEKLENEELEGVLAHELSHIGNRDMLVGTVAVVLAGVIAIASDIFLRATIWGRRSDNYKVGGIMIVIAIVAAILAPIAATIIRLSVSRQREFLADSSGALLTRFPDGLANALEKISHDHTHMRSAKNATAHLFLANPLRDKKEERSWFTKLFMTHPPIEERIKRLRNERV